MRKVFTIIIEYLNKESSLVRDEIIIGVIIGVISTLAVMIILWIFKDIVIKIISKFTCTILKKIKVS